jgi:aldose 1-epimerase
MEGKTVQLDKNRGEHHIHGGSEGFSRKVWEAFPIKNDEEAGVTLTLTSPDGDQGYPGTLEVRLTVKLSEENELSLAYEAKTDSPTPVNLTNHTYWNLAGQCSGPIYGHEIMINSSHYLETTEESLPTGRIRPVVDSRFDLREAQRIGDVLEGGGGFDHCFALSEENALSIPAAQVYEPESGRQLTVFTISPGLQFYTGNHLGGTRTRCGEVQRHGALCLETEEYPDSLHHENFPEVILQPGQRYLRKTVYLFSAER